MATETLRPNGAGDYTNIASQFPDSTYHWDKVDEAVQDGSDTYVYTYKAITNQYDVYNLQATSIPGGSTINSVTIYFVIDGSPGGAYCTPVLRLGGSITLGTDIPILGGWTIYSEALDRPGGGSWAVSDLNDLQAGVGLRAAGLVDDRYLSRCTQVFVEIDYTEVAPEEYSKTLSDVLAIVDTKLLSTGIIKSEVLSIETALGISAPGKQIITNIVSIGDTVTRKISKTFTEVLSVADTLTRTTVIKRVLADTLSLVDSAAKGVSKMVAASLAISATIIRQSQWGRTLTEAISIGDVRTLATKTIKSEVASVVDAVLKGSKRTITNIISLADIYGSRAQYKLVLSEVLSIKPTLLLLAGTALILTEIVAIGDAVTRKISKTLSEVLSVTDILNRANKKALAEVISLAASAKIREIGERIVMYLHSRTLSVYLHARTLTMKIHRRRTEDR